jgi:TolB-like protein/DNA-binding winged helix-turn-helix (wHTH) protein/tetratricopeptide (TPR) repeat protein
MADAVMRVVAKVEPREPLSADRSAEIHFDDWALRRSPRELLKAGGHVRLQDQPLQVLEELLTHPGEVVTREQLIARLWPKRVVDFDTALNATIRRLRVALGDAADTPVYIETVPRAGYRFIGTVKSSDESSVDDSIPDGRPERRNAGWWAAAGLVVLAAIGVLLWLGRPPDEPAPRVPGNPTIAVLPFADLSADQDQQYFSDGLAEEILNLLAQAPQLRVTARTSSFAYRGKSVDIPTVAEQLNVTHVLEGSVRKSGERVRVTAQLVDGATGLHVWSQTYDGDLNDIFTLQGEIAARVASALRVAIADRRPPFNVVDPRVYEHFLRAKFFFQRRAPGDLERAAREYHASLDLDPSYARAWAGLAGVYSVQADEGMLPRNDGLGMSRAAAERALELDPHSPEAHVRLTSYFFMTGDLARARHHWSRAIELEPGHPLVLGYRASDAVLEGRWEEALEIQRRAVAVDPLSLINRSNLAYILLLAGRYEEAAAESANAAKLDPSHLPETLADVLILEHRFEEALRLVDPWPSSPQRSKRLALIFARLGREAQADEALAALISSCEGAPCAVEVADVYAYRGDHDAAFGWLESNARSAREQGLSFAHLSPYLASLHADRRWEPWSASVRSAASSAEQ